LVLFFFFVVDLDY